ncbi:aminopeptidase N-like [Choristoneura fumiferana]|uniref:aminopeptidase N-like n=1 Tax=Choristoneura fumiferana TaxID=7141 RepID=UPI003D15DDB0
MALGYLLEQVGNFEPPVPSAVVLLGHLCVLSDPRTLSPDNPGVQIINLMFLISNVMVFLYDFVVSLEYNVPQIADLDRRECSGRGLSTPPMRLYNHGFCRRHKGKIISKGHLIETISLSSFNAHFPHGYLERGPVVLIKVYAHALDLSLYLDREEDYIPWGAANAAWSYLDVVLSGSPAVYEIFQEYALGLTAPLYQQFGFTAASGEEHVAAYHRNIILDINCRYGNQDCVNTASELLQNFRNNPSQRLNPDIQTIVYCSGLRGGDEENFEFLWQQYVASTDSSEQSILLSALGCTSNEELRQNYLNEVIDDNSPVREQDKHTIIVSVVNSSPEGMEAALEFIIEHWPQIQPRVQGLTGTTNILNAFARRLTTAEHSD